MNKIYPTFFIFFASFIIIQCVADEKENLDQCEKPAEEMIDHVPSELALLMKNMVLGADSIKKAIESDDPLIKFELSQEKLLTAKSVNERVESDDYKAMASAYLNLLEEFNEEKQNKILKFNGLIDGCMNCHEQICQGPMVRIKKLYIKE